MTFLLTSILSKEKQYCYIVSDFMQRKPGERDTLPADISCFHDHGKELALRLLYYLKIGRKNRQK